MRDYRQTEGFGGGWANPVMGIEEGTYCMEHQVYTQTMNHGMPYQKLRMYCMVTNIT